MHAYTHILSDSAVSMRPDTAAHRDGMQCTLMEQDDDAPARTSAAAAAQLENAPAFLLWVTTPVPLSLPAATSSWRPTSSEQRPWPTGRPRQRRRLARHVGALQCSQQERPKARQEDRRGRATCMQGEVACTPICETGGSSTAKWRRVH